MPPAHPVLPSPHHHQLLDPIHARPFVLRADLAQIRSIRQPMTMLISPKPGVEIPIRKKGDKLKADEAAEEEGETEES